MREGHSPDENALPTKDTLIAHYKALFETYRQHFDLFLKGYALVLAGVATAAGYAFSEVAPPTKRPFFLLFASALALVGVAGCVVGVIWTGHLERNLHQTQMRLGLSPLRIWGAKWVVGLGGAGMLIILTALVVYAWNLY